MSRRAWIGVACVLSPAGGERGTAWLYANRAGMSETALDRPSSGSYGVGCGLRGRIGPCVGNGREGSAKGSGVKARGSRAGLDEVTEDSADLLGIRDDGEQASPGRPRYTSSGRRGRMVSPRFQKPSLCGRTGEEPLTSGNDSVRTRRIIEATYGRDLRGQTVAFGS